MSRTRGAAPGTHRTAAAATTASADDDHWTTAPCATGSITGAVRGDDGTYVLLGEAGSCGTYVLGSMFAVARFPAGEPNGWVFSRGMRPYNADGSTRSFGTSLGRGFGTRHVCLMSSYTERLACAEVTVAQPSGRILFRSLPIDDPAVAKPVEWIKHNDPQPECSFCF